MGNVSPWGSLAGRIAGKWQLPLLALSLFTLPLGLYLLRPNPKSMPLDQVADLMEGFVSAGVYARAEEIGQLVVHREDCKGSAGAPVHLQMARALFGLAQQANRHTANASRAISEHYRQALVNNALVEPDDYVKLGRSLEWARQYNLALDWFEKGLSAGYRDRPALQRHAYLLRRDKLKAHPEELTTLLDQFLRSTPAEQIELVSWGLQERLGLLAVTSEIDGAREVLRRYQEQFAGSNFKGLFDYFEAWVLFHLGQTREAELALRAILNQTPADDPLSALAGWLIGRAIADSGEPERLMEAVSFFQGVIARHPASPYAIASRVNAAEVLASLGEDSQAAELYRFAIEDLEKVEISGLADSEVIRASLTVTAERRRRAGEMKAAVAYSKLISLLIDCREVEPAVAHLQQLGQLQSEWAEQIASSGEEEKSRELFLESSATYVRAAGLDTNDEERAAHAAWRAAELAARAGDRGEAIDLYRMFTESRPSNPLVPRALLRIGQLHQAAGRLTDAIVAYQECYNRYPKLLDGIRALVPLAQCYIFRGPDDLELAEKTLRIILEESEVFTPEAPEFADALFLLGDVLERRARYEPAISMLQEAIDRYPRDVRVARARFLLADSYRQSAFALKQEAMAADEADNIDLRGTEAAGRFAAARQAYRDLIDQYELRRVSELDNLERVYLRHAYLYEADCYFEARMYREALKRYDQAAGLLRDLPSALAAYVQIINCHVFLGELAEAKAALARAEVLTDGLRPEAFAQSVSPETKEEWKEYFAWLARAEIL